MKVLCILLISITVSYSAKYYVEPILRQENVLAKNGQFKFGFESRSQNVEQFRGDDGIIRGSYSYLDDNGNVQSMEYIAGPEGYQVYNANLPVTVASVTETPEVEAARRAHEEAFNIVKAQALAQRRVPPTFTDNQYNHRSSQKSPLSNSFTAISDDNVEYQSANEPVSYDSFKTVPSSHFPIKNRYNSLDSNDRYKNFETTPASYTSYKPVIHSQNYPVKNHYDTLEIKRGPTISTEKPFASYIPTGNPTQHVKVKSSSFPHINHNEPEIVNPVPSKPKTVPQISPQAHLEAVKNAIAAQLVAYKNVPSEIPQSDEAQSQSGYRTELASPLKFQHYSSNSELLGNQKSNFETEDNRKLAVIAAARALMKILNEN